MDEQGIDVEALSINPYWYRAERDLAPRSIKIQNEPLAESCAATRTASSPSPRWRCSIRTSPPEQLEDGVKKLGLRGAAVGASVAGDEFSDPKFHPFWAKAEELGRADLHPSAGHRRTSPRAARATAGWTTPSATRWTPRSRSRT